MKGLLTTAEVAGRWGCTAQWVQALCKSGRLKCQSIGGIYLIREVDADNYDRKPPGRPATKKTKSRKR